MIAKSGAKQDLQSVALLEERTRFVENIKAAACQQLETTFTFIVDDVHGGWKHVTSVSEWLLDEAVAVRPGTGFYSKVDRVTRKNVRLALVSAFGEDDPKATHELVYDNPNTISEVARIVPKRGDMHIRPRNEVLSA